MSLLPAARREKIEARYAELEAEYLLLILFMMF